MSRRAKIVYNFVKPIITPTLQTVALISTGDVIAQTVVEKRKLKDVNLVRTGQFACVGLFMAGPILSTWYRILAKYVGTTGGSVTLKKVALDQLLFAPCFLAGFLATLGKFQGDENKVVISNIKTHYPDILITSYKLWPGVQLVNFYLVPLKHQVLVVQCVALFFNSYLSWKTQSNRSLT